MSMADTAEYQLASLAKAMTTALQEAQEHGWRSPDYRSGYMDALEEIADVMGLRETKVFTYP